MSDSRIPLGTSSELTDLLHGLLKRNPKERFEFEAFFTHPFLASTPLPVPKSNVKLSEEKLPSSPETAGFVVVPPMPKSSPIPVPAAKSESSSQNNSPITQQKSGDSTQNLNTDNAAGILGLDRSKTNG